MNTSFQRNENLFTQRSKDMKDCNSSFFTHQSMNTSRIFGRELTNNLGYKIDASADKSKIAGIKAFSNPQINPLKITPANSLKTSFTGDSVVERMTLELRGDANKSTGLVITQANPSEDYDMETFDIDNYDNPQYTVSYIKDIMNHLRIIEEKTLPSSTYFPKIQKDINETMRAILIDWLIDVHLKFKLLPETLFMTVYIVDRYLSCVELPRQKLQLLGVCSMLIACKYEEIYAPEIKEFEYVTDKAYSKQEIIEMEGKILNQLNFKIVTASSYRFLERYGRLANLDEKGLLLARYLLELALMEFKMLKYTPSNIACSAIYLVNKIFKKQGWPDSLARSCKYSDSQVRICAKDLCIILQNAGKTKLQAAKKKFSQPKYLEVARLQFDKI